jgi:hypothetical protein
MRLSPWILPLLVFLAIAGGYTLRTSFTQPTTVSGFQGIDGAKCTAIVDGLKCKGTAAYFSSLYDSTSGVIAIETFASENKAVITYDPDLITRDSIKTIMEQIVTFDDGTSSRVFTCRSID